jgi:hypothetical protein
MANRRLYRRTPAGTAAWQRQDTNVPLEFRRVLGVIDGDMHPDSFRGRLPFTEVGLSHVLEELVEQGFLEAVEAAEHHDLDFTGNLNLSDLRKAAASR